VRNLPPLDTPPLSYDRTEARDHPLSRTMSLLSSIRQMLPSVHWLLGPPEATGPFTPTYTDVCRARALLKTLKLPTELVLSILEHAQYWPVAEFSRSGRPTLARAGMNNPSAATLCLEAGVYSTPIVEEIRLGGETAKIKRIEFDVTSKDQGWTSENTEGTFSTSSWLEVSILRDASNLNSLLPTPRLVNTWISSPMDYHTNMVGRGWSLVKRPESALQGPQGGEGHFAWYLQGNRVMAGSQDYHVAWEEGGLSDVNEGNEGAGSGEGFLDALRPGDRVLVWARAKVRLRCGIVRVLQLDGFGRVLTCLNSTQGGNALSRMSALLFITDSEAPIDKDSFSWIHYMQCLLLPGYRLLGV
jgi:hypothetical protein